MSHLLLLRCWCEKKFQLRIILHEVKNVEISYGLYYFPPSPSHMKIKKISLMVLRGFKKVCLCVCLSVCASPLQSQITFYMLVGWQPNFQGLLISSQVILGQVTWTPRPSGSGPDPEKAGFCQIYLLPGFWGRGFVSHLFGIGTTRPTKCWEQNFDCLPTARENGAGRWG